MSYWAKIWRSYPEFNGESYFNKIILKNLKQQPLVAMVTIPDNNESKEKATMPGFSIASEANM